MGCLTTPIISRCRKNDGSGSCRLERMVTRAPSRGPVGFGKYRQFRLALQGKIRQNLTKFDELPWADVMTEERENCEVRFGVSPTHHAYLTWLMGNTVLGRTENEVAKQILTQQLTEMRQENYREGKAKD